MTDSTDGPAAELTHTRSLHATGARGPDARRTPGRLPDFFIVGHEKCGSTALYRMLRSHPHVFMPELKEPRFFMRERPTQRAPGDADAERSPGTLPQTLAEYVALFADARAEQVAGEASPQYIRSPSAAARIAALRPDARAIAILREPAAFLRSFHLACVRSGLEDERDLRKALELEPSRKRGEKIPPGCNAPDRLLYGEHVRYVEQLRRFESALARERVHVIVYDDLRRENERVARAALRFLGVDETLPIDVSNSTGRERKAVRNVRLHRFATALRRARRRPDSSPPLLRALGSIATPRVQGVARRALYTPPPPVQDALAQELRERFRPEVAALAEHLDRDLLAQWGYAAASPDAGDWLR